MRRLLLLAPVALLLTATPASGAEGRLHVAGQPSDARVAFDLAPAWEQARGEMAGTPMTGIYSLTAPGRPENEHCVLGLNASGLSVRRSQRPVLRRGVLTLRPRSWWGSIARLRIAHRSRAGARSLYRTRLAASRVTGIAVLPTPSWIRPRRPVTVVQISIGVTLTVLGPEGRVEPTPEQEAACDAFAESQLGPALRRALKSVTIVRRSS